MRIGLLVLVGCANTASPPPANVGRTELCPPGTTETAESTVEGPNTWFACRDSAGRPHGPSRMTFASGKPRNAGAYRAGEADGLWTHWDERGRVEMTGHWRNGKREGRWVWSDSNGSRVEEYAGGLVVGHFTRRFRDGTLAEAGDYRAGQQVGTWKQWNAAGVLVREEHYVAGRREGAHRGFHHSGALASALTYVHGEPHGAAVTFHENGAKASEGAYVDGHRAGRWVSWNPDGTLASEGEMVDGKRHGDWKLGGRVVHFEAGREGHLRPCPAGSTERIECVARCCDETGRWCERPDGTRVGPSDVWDAYGTLIKSTP